MDLVFLIRYYQVVSADRTGDGDTTPKSPDGWVSHSGPGWTLWPHHYGHQSFVYQTAHCVRGDVARGCDAASFVPYQDRQSGVGVLDNRTKCWLAPTACGLLWKRLLDLSYMVCFDVGFQEKKKRKKSSGSTYMIPSCVSNGPWIVAFTQKYQTPALLHDCMRLFSPVKHHMPSCVSVSASKVEDVDVKLLNLLVCSHG